MKPNNIFATIPSNLELEVFEQLAGNENVTIERIVSKGQKSPTTGWYNQQHNEWVLVLKGKAVLTFETKESISLSEGDFINIPAYKKHKVEWTDPAQETIWLVVKY